MNFRILVCLSMIVIVGCGGKVDYEYYSNGNIKRSTEMKDGRRHGTLVEYYEDGSVSKEQHWENGIVQGSFVDYYLDGSIYRRGEVVNNRMVSYNVYHTNGVVHQIHRFDSTGNLTELEFYDEEEKRDSIAYYDLQLFPGDTLKVHQMAILKCKLFNRVDPVYQKGELLITSGFDTTNFGVAPKDTVAVVAQDNFVFEYQFLPTNTGRHCIYGVFIHLESEDAKTRTVVTHEFEYPFLAVDKR